MPTPEPSLVLFPDIVGFDEKPYATPREVTVAPPSDVTTPPSVAELEVIPVAFKVIVVGIVALPILELSFTQRTEKPLRWL